jgi:hypothetical protein
MPSSARKFVNRICASSDCVGLRYAKPTYTLFGTGREFLVGSGRTRDPFRPRRFRQIAIAPGICMQLRPAWRYALQTRVLVPRPRAFIHDQREPASDALEINVRQSLHTMHTTSDCRCTKTTSLSAQCALLIAPYGRNTTARERHDRHKSRGCIGLTSAIRTQVLGLEFFVVRTQFPQHNDVSPHARFLVPNNVFGKSGAEIPTV